jgi:hypothetical protein
MSTLAEIVTRVEDRISMVAGTGVQTYAEDRIAEMVQHKFDTLFDEVFWPHLSVWSQWTLDETLGVVTADLTDLIDRFDDIQAIFPENSNSALTKLASTTTNPFQLSGTTPIHFDALGPDVSNVVTKVFHIWPKAATGDVIVRYRVRPAPYVSVDEVNFDDQALILGAAYDYLEDDGTNPGATQKMQGLYEARVRQLKNNYNDAPIALDPITSTPQSFSFVELP